MNKSELLIISIALISVLVLLSGCVTTDGSGDSNAGKKVGKCGDGVCGPSEGEKDNCPQDCQTQTTEESPEQVTTLFWKALGSYEYEKAKEFYASGSPFMGKSEATFIIQAYTSEKTGYGKDTFKDFSTELLFLKNDFAITVLRLSPEVLENVPDVEKPGDGIFVMNNLMKEDGKWKIWLMTLGSPRTDIIVNDIKDCDGFEGNDAYECKQLFAINTLNEDLCEEVPKTTSKEGVSKDWCFRKIAGYKVDQSICNNIEGDYLKGRCIKDITE